MQVKGVSPSHGLVHIRFLPALLACCLASLAYILQERMRRPSVSAALLQTVQCVA